MELGPLAWASRRKMCTAACMAVPFTSGVMLGGSKCRPCAVPFHCPMLAQMACNRGSPLHPLARSRHRPDTLLLPLPRLAHMLLLLARASSCSQVVGGWMPSCWNQSLRYMSISQRL